MILGPITLVDCLAFVCLFLVNIVFYPSQCIAVLLYAIKASPFLVLKLPVNLLLERLFTPKSGRSPFVQQASFFEDLVIRCVRYAFATLPASVGRIFFSKGVAYPFYRWRLLRSGYLRLPFHLEEIKIGYNEHDPRKTDVVKGVWMVFDPARRADVVIYYCHGGGFAMGSSYFYIEFLMAWAYRLRTAGFKNPGILALDYTLVPDKTWPTQVKQTTAGWNYLCEHLAPASRICICGDSAGATLVLSHLLGRELDQDHVNHHEKPAMAILISPWTHLISTLNRDTDSDYLSKLTLEIYAKQYAGRSQECSNISPSGDGQQWRNACPIQGFAFVYGAEEVFAPATEATAQQIRRAGCSITLTSLKGGIHAWPVVDFFLADSQKRFRGLDRLTEIVRDCFSPQAEVKTSAESFSETIGK